MSDDLLVCNGGSLKALDSEGRFGGYAITFGTPDEADPVGDYFTPKTDYWLEGKSALPVVYGHGHDPVMKNRRLTYADFKVDDTGLWAEGQIDIHDRWLAKVWELIQKGVLSWSSGAVGHLVSRLERLNSRGKKTFEITSWPIGEISGVPNPADHRNTIRELKSFVLPSLNETIRISKLSLRERLKHESDEVQAKALRALGERPPVDVWAERQTARSINHRAQVGAKLDYLKLRDEAQVKLKELAQLEKQYEQLIKNNQPRYARGAMPKWMSR